LEYVYIKRNAPVWSPTNRRLSWLENKNNKSSLVGDQTTERKTHFVWLAGEHFQLSLVRDQTTEGDQTTEVDQTPEDYQLLQVDYF